MAYVLNVLFGWAFVACVYVLGFATPVLDWYNDAWVGELAVLMLLGLVPQAPVLWFAWNRWRYVGWGQLSFVAVSACIFLWRIANPQNWENWEGGV